MKVYITYDRYEHDEWFNLYQITTKMSEVRKEYKKNLIDFISYGPDDCHSYQIQIVDLTKEEYELLKSHIDDTVEDEDEVMELMIRIYEECVPCQYPNSNCLISTDGCSDNWELVHYYGKKKGLDTEDDDVYYEVEEELFGDNDLYEQELEKYINDTY